ncbi:MAG: hypothetical protein J6Q84_02870 [Kiritimatiellae bacterium]|nr:hypothetical protein [Kiritimatiellia bacterium]
MAYALEIGGVYYATPALEGAKKRIVAVIGRQGEHVQLAFLEELAVGKAVEMHGREVASVDTDSGMYTVSAAVPANASDAAIVMDIVNGKRWAGMYK